MLGQITNVIGKEPRYPTMALQGAIAAANDPDDTMHFVHDENKPLFADAIRKMQRNQHCYPTIKEEMMEWKNLKPILNELNDASLNADYNKVSKILSEIVPGFTPKSYTRD